ncbi:hypothetical protein Poly41_32900 [Novipirellula artificiosorum]|uniref:DUF1800 domain-containing protein n=2 Tax=Novipirellula artificiosorum TaxID=2528016 RepID=A0A5C6DIH0_9BACT|nr:hypothetical protein Poly41_32900 [Novipirellula artificiosorum]
MSTDLQIKSPAEKDAVVSSDWAWAEYTPSDEHPWTLELAGHLYRRAGFGANYGELQRALQQGPRRAVDRLLLVNEPLSASYRAIEQDEQAAAKSGNRESLQAWWLRRMVESPFPLLEKMTLFWHSHFGIRFDQVRDASLMLDHMGRLRDLALGKYPELLSAIASDPAVFLGVGAETSRKSQPNEQFARQLMQRLSVGAGNFGEEDVREASRAFTGWFVLRGKLRYFDREHDEGAKNILGRTGNWKVQDVVRIVLEHPLSAETLAAKLYRWFVSEVDQPTSELLAPLTGMLSKDYDIRQVVEVILRSNLFYSKVAYRRRIKSPVEYGVGIVRALEGSVSTVRLAEDLNGLGQSLYNPPTIEGWHGGHHWINAATMAGRMNLAGELLAPEGRYGGKLDPASLVQRYGSEDAPSAAKLLGQLLLQDDVAKQTRERIDSSASDPIGGGLANLRPFATRLVNLPEFQLS